MRKFLLALSALALLSPAAFSQRPCTDSLYRQFDFWIGDWEAYGINGKKAGDSHIELLLDSCVIQENWTSASVVKGLRFAGKSFNSYDAIKERWQQYWVDNTGTITEYFNGHYENGKMILETDNIRQADGSYKIQKMTFYNLGPDKVRQHGESSSDGGRTWKTDYDLEYRRKK